MTSIVNAEVDGHRLSDEEIGAFLILLASAGNDTTKQATTHAMMALVANPSQRAWLMADFENRIGQAVEEFVRYASPVLQFARFVTEDTEIKRANRLARATRSACSTAGQSRRERLRRPPLLQPAALTQSAPRLRRRGPHFCLGNQLARTELRNLFRELLTRRRPSSSRTRPAAQQLRPRSQTRSGVRSVGEIHAGRSRPRQVHGARNLRIDRR